MEMIPVTTVMLEGTEKLTCNARDLHAFLGVGRDFSTWFKERIARYEFVEDVDFILLPNFGEHDPCAWGGQNRIDYALTLDMAKELAMVENNARGREIRRYFIACERRAREVSAADKNIYEYAEALLAERDRRMLAEDKLRYLKPKTPFGTPSRFNGRPRTSLVGPFWKTTTTTVTTEVIEYQRSLFDSLPVPQDEGN